MRGASCRRASTASRSPRPSPWTSCSRPCAQAGRASIAFSPPGPACTRGRSGRCLPRGRVRVDGAPATGISQVIDEFTRVQLDERVLQARQRRLHHAAQTRRAWSAPPATRSTGPSSTCWHAPTGTACTSPAGWITTPRGLLLLTNDGRWSTAPERARQCRAQALPGDPGTASHRGLHQGLRRGHVFSVRGHYHPPGATADHRRPYRRGRVAGGADTTRSSACSGASATGL